MNPLLYGENIDKRIENHGLRQSIKADVEIFLKMLGGKIDVYNDKKEKIGSYK